MNNHLSIVLTELVREISFKIDKIGVFHRCFGRVKTSKSINDKILKKNYSILDKKMQDLYGIRITLYFFDDIDIVKNYLKREYNFLSEEIDVNNDETFKATRVNLIFRLGDASALDASIALKSYTPHADLIDNTFELQIRTVFSEGWHEVEHDFRYKNKDAWEKQETLSRVLNGIYASLETNDWSIVSILDKMAYFHYEERNWSMMIANKFRLRLVSDVLSQSLKSILDCDYVLAKKILKISRADLLQKISHPKMSLPLTINNIIFIINACWLKQSSITECQGELVNDILKKCYNY